MSKAKARRLADEIGVLLAWGSLVGLFLSFLAIWLHVPRAAKLGVPADAASGVWHALAFYIPIIAAAVAFYQGMRKRTADDRAVLAAAVPNASGFLKTVYVTLLLAPVAIYLFAESVTSGNNNLAEYQILIQSLLAAALAYYFGAPDDQRQPAPGVRQGASS